MGHISFPSLTISLFFVFRHYSLPLPLSLLLLLTPYILFVVSANTWHPSPSSESIFLLILGSQQHPQSAPTRLSLPLLLCHPELPASLWRGYSERERERTTHTSKPLSFSASLQLGVYRRRPHLTTTWKGYQLQPTLRREKNRQCGFRIHIHRPEEPGNSGFLA